MEARKNILTHPCWPWNGGHRWRQRHKGDKVSRLGFMFCYCDHCDASGFVHVWRGFRMCDDD